MLGKLKDYLREHTDFGKSRYLNFLYRYDMGRYLQYGGKENKDPATELRLLAHALEKGLSVTQDRVDFGKEKALRLLALTELCENSQDSQSKALGQSVLAAYRDFRVEKGLDVSFLPDTLEKKLAGGAVDYTPMTLDGFEIVAHGRHSIRCFAPGAVDMDALTAAVALAQTAPSACNRQSSRVYVCTAPEKIGKIMARHGGTRGFSNTGAILALTGELGLFTSEYERNAVFVDGGIFLMNLLYSLQCKGLGACPVIWGAEPDNDDFLYRLLGIPKSEEIISLVMVGNLPQGVVRIPASQKRNTGDILKIVE